MEVTCLCGEVFAAKRKDARYCSDRCAKRAQRGAGAAPARSRRGRPRAGGQRGSQLERWTRQSLAGVGRVDTWAGQAALILARRIDQAAGETASALATAIKEHAAAMDRALAEASQGDPVEALQDQVAERRAERERSAATG